MGNYQMVEIQGKHGMINLGIPTREATEEEINETYRALAQVIVNNNKNKVREKEKKKEKATSK